MSLVLVVSQFRPREKEEDVVGPKQLKMFPVIEYATMVGKLRVPTLFEYQIHSQPLLTKSIATNNFRGSSRNSSIFNSLTLSFVTSGASSSKGLVANSPSQASWGLGLLAGTKSLCNQARLSLHPS